MSRDSVDEALLPSSPFDECDDKPSNSQTQSQPITFNIILASGGSNDVWDVSVYNGPPSPAVDAAWDALYARGIMQLPKSEADRLPNKTAPIPGDENNYIFNSTSSINCTGQYYYNDTFYVSRGVDNPMKINVEGHERFDHTGH
ncbi:hypothetical protein BS17DRAFT_823355 [Gyrodon lividus]|nr:hypothetical protein BS17DRAFT_823355 [Gyrodon lividus]